MKHGFKAFLFLCLWSSQLWALPAYTFTMRNPNYPERLFTFEIDSDNHEGIESFEQYLSQGEVLLDPQGNPVVGVANGELVAAIKTPEHDWDFGLKSETLHFADFTMKLCDGSFAEVENDLEYWFTKVQRLCPWGTARFLIQIKRQDQIIYQRSPTFIPLSVIK